MCLAQGHNAVTPEPAATRSRVKHSTTEPLLIWVHTVCLGFFYSKDSKQSAHSHHLISLSFTKNVGPLLNIERPSKTDQTVRMCRLIRVIDGGTHANMYLLLDTGSLNT